MLPTDPKARKNVPIATGVLDYFPDALAAVAEVSRIGNEQHNPGKPLHWDRSKSTDEADALMRHFVERGTIDSDGSRHSAKVAWRALALLQKEIEAARVPLPVPKAPEPGKDGWIEWDGGRIAVGDYKTVPQRLSPTTNVQAELRNGHFVTRPAQDFAWWHDNSHSDIVAYRVVD